MYRIRPDDVEEVTDDLMRRFIEGGAVINGV
jgi:hypothetical protein